MRKVESIPISLSNLFPLLSFTPFSFVFPFGALLINLTHQPQIHFVIRTLQTQFSHSKRIDTMSQCTRMYLIASARSIIPILSRMRTTTTTATGHGRRRRPSRPFPDLDMPTPITRQNRILPERNTGQWLMVNRRRHQWLQHCNPRSPFRRSCHRHRVFSFLFSIHRSSHSHSCCCRGRGDTASVFRLSRITRVGVMEHCRKTVWMLLLLCRRCTRRVAVIAACSIEMQVRESPRGMLQRFPWRLAITAAHRNTRTLRPGSQCRRSRCGITTSQRIQRRRLARNRQPSTTTTISRHRQDGQLCSRSTKRRLPSRFKN